MVKLAKQLAKKLSPPVESPQKACETCGKDIPQKEYDECGHPEAS